MAGARVTVREMDLKKRGIIMKMLLHHRRQFL